MHLSSTERSILAALASDLRERFAAIEVRVFGSAARGELDRESDVDVFVVVPELSWPLEQAIYDRCYDATLACGRLVCATVFDRRELVDSPLCASPLVQAVRREGIPL